MEYGESLSLRQAAEFANVSEPTMRLWVKEIPNVERNSTGGYIIPRDELTGFLGVKMSRKFGASIRGRDEPQSTPKENQIVEGLKRERDKAESEALFLRERVKEVEGINSRLAGDLSRIMSDFSSLSREYMALLKGENPKQLPAAWANKVREQNEERPKKVETARVSKKPEPSKLKVAAKAPAKVSLKKTKATKAKTKSVKKKTAAKSGKR